jgi:hypothetical protein
MSAPVDFENEPEPGAPEARSTSPAQCRANRENAQKSTGPRSTEAREKSSRNALKTGLTGNTVLLPTDDPELYRAHVQHHHDELCPAGQLETQLVQRIADAQWRLNRIPTLEANLYKYGRFQFASLFESEPDPEDRAALIQAHTRLTFQKEFSNLSIQENRIRRGYEKDLNELKALQSQRGKLAEDTAIFRRWPAPWPGGRKTGFEFSEEANANGGSPMPPFIIGCGQCPHGLNNSSEGASDCQAYSDTGHLHQIKGKNPSPSAPESPGSY